MNNRPYSYHDGPRSAFTLGYTLATEGTVDLGMSAHDDHLLMARRAQRRRGSKLARVYEGCRKWVFCNSDTGAWLALSSHR